MTTARVLVSYHYHRKTDLAALAAALGGAELFADSGAYSAATSGTVIKLADYAAWLTDWAPLLAVRANLDVIGNATATTRNQTALEDAGHEVLPVFHTCEPWEALAAILTRHTYVGLGGLALHSVGRRRERELMAWLVRAFRMARDTGAVYHAFGVTAARLVTRLPFYSLDSSSYMFAQRWGLLYAWDAPHLAMRSIHLRNPRELGQHGRLLAANGLSTARLADPQFMRAGPGVSADRQYAAVGGARAYQMMETSLIARHRVPAPGGQHGPGTKVFLAVGDSHPASLAPIAQASAVR